jgi:hypothetical protein
MSLETLKVFETFRVWDINRVEPRESNSRPVLGRVFIFNPLCALVYSVVKIKKEVAMTEDSTVTRQRPGGG